MDVHEYSDLGATGYRGMLQIQKQLLTCFDFFLYYLRNKSIYEDPIHVQTIVIRAVHHPDSDLCGC